MKKDNFVFKILKTIFISLVLIVIVILIDFFNLFSTISCKLNSSFLEIIINNIIIIMMFIITYFLIDKRNMEKDEEKRKNQEYVLKQLLVETYSECKKTIKLLDDNEILSKYIVPKVDFDKTDLDNVVVINLKNSPFKNESTILDLFKEGIFSTIHLHNYLRIKSEYQGYISIRITFFDKEELTQNSKKKINEDLDSEFKYLIDEEKKRNC